MVGVVLGIVLSADGGALEQMLPPFKLGVGGVLGNGSQAMSWISLEDAVGAIGHALTHDELAGPVNAVAPHAVTNKEFTKTLGRVLLRPTLFPVPTFAVKAAFGQMGQELLLASARVEPKRLLETGFTFEHTELEPALREAVE